MAYHTLPQLNENFKCVNFGEGFTPYTNLYVYSSPPVNPPKEIVDPEDKKPEDWDEREK